MSRHLLRAFLFNDLYEHIHMAWLSFITETRQMIGLAQLADDIRARVWALLNTRHIATIHPVAED
jgi:hypothetical protein